MTQIQINIQMLFPYMVLCLIIHLCEISQNDLLRHPIRDTFDEGTEKARGVNLLSKCKQPAITMPWPSYLPQTLFTGNLSVAVFPSLHWNVTHNIPTVSAHCHGSQTWREDRQLYYSQLVQHHMAIPCRIQAIIIFCCVFWPFDYSKAALLLKTVLYIYISVYKYHFYLGSPYIKCITWLPTNHIQRRSPVAWQPGGVFVFKDKKHG